MERNDAETEHSSGIIDLETHPHHRSPNTSRRYIGTCDDIRAALLARSLLDIPSDEEEA